MPGYVPPRSRNLVPRWRTPEITSSLGQLHSGRGRKPCPIVDEEMDEALARWRALQSPSCASEVVAAALVSGQSHRAHDAAAFLADLDDRLPLRSEMSKRILARSLPSEEQTYTSARDRIHAARVFVRSYPSNALAWVDLALSYTNVAHSARAAQCIDVALSLAPENRYVLRSAVRFFLHIGKAERAFHLLQRSPVVECDPWLMSAELAVISLLGRSPKSIKSVRNLLSSADFSDYEISELASQFATIQYRDGRRSEARKLFSVALKSPTDNTVAQFRWITTHDNSFLVPSHGIVPPRMFEADAIKSSIAGHWSDAITSAWKWYGDEPFACRPTALGSYIAADITEDYEQARRFAEAGLKSNPGNPVLVNNLAYALAQLSDLSRAKEQLDTLKGRDLQPFELIAKLATDGLIAYRQNNLVEGRGLYEQAIETSRGPDLLKHRQMVSLHMALEELRAATGDAAVQANRALREVEKAPAPDVRVLRDRVVQALERHTAERNSRNHS